MTARFCLTSVSISIRLSLTLVLQVVDRSKDAHESQAVQAGLRDTTMAAAMPRQYYTGHTGHRHVYRHRAVKESWGRSAVSI